MKTFRKDFLWGGATATNMKVDGMKVDVVQP